MTFSKTTARYYVVYVDLLRSGNTVQGEPNALKVLPNPAADVPPNKLVPAPKVVNPATVDEAETDPNPGLF